MQIRPPSTNYILVYFFSGLPGKHPDTLQVESFLLQFCPGPTPICYNFTRLIQFANAYYIARLLWTQVFISSDEHTHTHARTRTHKTYYIHRVSKKKHPLILLAI